MGILGKDMFDMDRMYTNTRVEFGAAGYWVEEKVYPLPYGFVLTEILNMDVTPFQEALDELESVISQSHTEAVLGTFFNVHVRIKERRKDGIQNVRSLQGSCRFGSFVNQLCRTDIIRRDSVDVKFISHDAKVGV